MKGVRRRGGTYFVDFYSNGRRTRKVVGNNRKTAEAVLHKYKAEVVEGKFLDVDKTEKIRFEDFTDEYLKVHSINNKSYYKDELNIKMLKRFFGGRHIHEVTSLDVERFKAERAKEVSVATTNRGLALLKSMFNRAIEWRKVKENPCRSVKLFKENNQILRYLEGDEIRKLISNCDGYLRGIVTTALFTGMRKGEILSLKWHDCDFERQIIRITNTKNKETRIVPMHNLVKKTMIAMPKHPDSAYIFHKRNGEPFINVRKSFDKLLKTCKIVNFRFHDLRHTFASQLAMAGVDLNTIRELLGHKSIQMTLRYAHLSPDHKRRAVDTLMNRMGTIWAQNASSDNSKELTVSQVFENKEVTFVGL